MAKRLCDSSQLKLSTAYIKVEKMYRERTSTSRHLHEQACHFFPMGDTRSSLHYSPYPTYIVRGEGFTIEDADGNRYIDFLNNYTSLIHGHAFPPVTEALRTQAKKGTSFGAHTKEQIELAQLLFDRITSIESIRFCNSGTEAVLMALRAARTFTGKEKIVKIEGGYHGNIVEGETSLTPSIENVGPREFPASVPCGAGFPEQCFKDVIVIPFNDTPIAEKIISSHRNEIAGVLVEPQMGAAGQIPGMIDYLNGLREITKIYGILLVFDEIQCFRLDYGGVQRFVGVKPDLTTLGKIIGGGMPVGAFGGREDIMNVFSPEGGKISHRGTFNANPMSMVGGLANMQAYNEGAIQRLNLLGDSLREKLRLALHDVGIKAVVSGFGSLFHIHYGAESIREYRDARTAADQVGKLPGLIHLALLNRGIYTAPRGMIALSTPMTNQELEVAADAYHEALLQLRPLIETEFPHLIKC